MTRTIVLLIALVSVAACDDGGLYANDSGSSYNAGSSDY